jgi:AcrR family transcriptional regulator
VSTEESHTPIWARPAPGERKPRFTREQIARAAVKVADEEGLEAVSMRRVAAELGAGTMTLYHYVDNKSELLALMGNELMGELLIPDDELADDWREAMAQIGRRTYGVFQNHGWTFEETGEAEDVGGPNGMRHFEQSMRAAALTGLPEDRHFEVITHLDDYVFGYVKRQRDLPKEVFFDDYELPQPVFEYLEEQLATGEYPHIQRFVGDADSRAFFHKFVDVVYDPDRFERGLTRLLDGIAVEVERDGNP